MAIELNVPKHVGFKVLFVMILRRLTPAIAIAFIAAIAGFLLERFDTIANFIQLGPQGNAIIEAAISAVFLFGTIISLVFAFFIILYNIIAYFFYFYTIGEFSLEVNRGIIYREDVSISYRQIRNVNITQPLLYVLFRIARTDIYTLTNADDAVNPNQGIDMEIVLDRDLAEEIQEFLVKKSNIGEIVELPSGIKINMPSAKL